MIRLTEDGSARRTIPYVISIRRDHVIDDNFVVVEIDNRKCSVHIAMCWYQTGHCGTSTGRLFFGTETGVNNPMSIAHPVVACSHSIAHPTSLGDVPIVADQFATAGAVVWTFFALLRQSGTPYSQGPF